MTIPKCARLGCTADARLYPIIIAYARGHDPKTHEPARIAAEIPHCTAHARDAKIEHMFDAGGRRKIDDMFRAAGKAPPDWETAQLDWEDILAKDRQLRW